MGADDRGRAAPRARGLVYWPEEKLRSTGLSALDSAGEMPPSYSATAGDEPNGASPHTKPAAAAPGLAAGLCCCAGPRARPPAPAPSENAPGVCAKCGAKPRGTYEPMRQMGGTVPRGMVARMSRRQTRSSAPPSMPPPQP